MLSSMFAGVTDCGLGKGLGYQMRPVSGVTRLFVFFWRCVRLYLWDSLDSGGLNPSWGVLGKNDADEADAL